MEPPLQYIVWQIGRTNVSHSVNPTQSEKGESRWSCQLITGPIIDCIYMHLSNQVTWRNQVA